MSGVSSVSSGDLCDSGDLRLCSGWRAAMVVSFSSGYSNLGLIELESASSLESDRDEFQTLVMTSKTEIPMGPSSHGGMIEDDG